MDINEATVAYEAWLGQYITPVEADLATKHKLMSRSPFVFLRATAYRWAQRWRHVCPDLVSAPPVASVGDLHVENFGTWRDPESRLVWGVNDLDEVATLPYTNDLLRLVTSIILAAPAGRLSLVPNDAADSVLEGYAGSLGDGGRPFVLAEGHRWLSELAAGRQKPPPTFWGEIQGLPDLATGELAPDLTRALERAVPGTGLAPRYLRRVAGVGSLGRPRVVALASWRGGCVGREAKAIIPSAWRWADGTAGEPEAHGSEMAALIDHAVRCPDPTYRPDGAWLVRRLAPDAVRIELDGPRAADERRLVRAMGRETANLHLASRAASDILADLAARPKHWLSEAAQRMAKDTSADWERWRSAGR
ncbi:MAG TPA: DUF2252 family protein [Acidimicrobiales bacterium]|nr:DUF2252 family protein [Acidimicrobiales bacterium]